MKIKKILIKVFISFLVITALIAIISVLVGDFGWLQLRISATTFIISVTSICLMTCATFIEKLKMKKLGFAGIILSIAGATSLIFGIWLDISYKGYWNISIALIVSAIAFTHAFLLILPQLDDNQKWVQKISFVSVGILAIQIMIAVWNEIDNEIYYRLIAVIAILVTLETIVIFILMKLQRKNSKKTELLILEKVEGEVYKDSTGIEYKVIKINTEQSIT